MGDRGQAVDRLQAVEGLLVVIAQVLELEFAEQLVVQKAVPENAFTQIPNRKYNDECQTVHCLCRGLHLIT